MATRAAIAIANDTHLLGVYLHWDGYPSHAGRILTQHWNRRALVELLIAQGDISSIGAGLGIKHDFDGPRPADSCTFYRRDRGEEGCDAREFRTAEDFVEEMAAAGCEFFYIFGWDDRWWISSNWGPLQNTWCPVSESFQKMREIG